MASQQGTVRVCRQGQSVTFQVTGFARMYQSLPVRRVSESSLAEGVNTVRVDLRHCHYLDSTFLGTLLYLRRALERRGQRRFLLVSPSPECCRLFKQMGVEDCLPAVAEDDLSGAGWLDLPCEPEDAEVFNRNVLQAHQELANLGGTAGKTFSAVARSLEKDLQGKDIP